MNLRESLGPLRERSFRYLFLGRTTSFIGNAFANVALAFAVLDLTGSATAVGSAPVVPAHTAMSRSR